MATTAHKEGNKLSLKSNLKRGRVVGRIHSQLQSSSLVAQVGSLQSLLTIFLTLLNAVTLGRGQRLEDILVPTLPCKTKETPYYLRKTFLWVYFMFAPSECGGSSEGTRSGSDCPRRCLGGREADGLVPERHQGLRGTSRLPRDEIQGGKQWRQTSRTCWWVTSSTFQGQLTC